MNPSFPPNWREWCAGALGADTAAEIALYAACESDEDNVGALSRALHTRDADFLSARFSQRIKFGTAGLRGRIDCGIACMNCVTVAQATEGVLAFLIGKFGLAEVRRRGVVVGFDGRRKSRRFALEIVRRIFDEAGVSVFAFGCETPTPLVPFAVVARGAAFGIMITASHNPKDDNGYKAYGANGAQIYGEEAAAIEREILKIIQKRKQQMLESQQQAPIVAEAPIDAEATMEGQAGGSLSTVTTSASRPVSSKGRLSSSLTKSSGDSCTQESPIPQSSPQTLPHTFPMEKETATFDGGPGNGNLEATWTAYKSAVCDQLMSSKTLEGCDFKVVYTALHGVAFRFVQDLVVNELGFPAENFVSVPEQQEIDCEFSTLKFPNPEEKGALDLAIALAEKIGAKFIVANDPDGDRFIFLERQNNQGGTAFSNTAENATFRRFSGDDIGLLFAAFLTDSYANSESHETPQRSSQAKTSDALPMGVYSSAVSSDCLRRFAEFVSSSSSSGVQVRHETTLTGFKWLANVGLERAAEGKATFCYAYEEALGYALMPECLPDKDGLSAIAAFLLQAKIFQTKKLSGAAAGPVPLSSQLFCGGATPASFAEWLECIKSKIGFSVTKNSYFVCADPKIKAEIFARIRDWQGSGDYPKSLGRTATGEGLRLVKVRDVSLGVTKRDGTKLLGETDLDCAREEACSSPELPVTPNDDFVSFFFERGIIHVRCSGTESKVKYYAEFFDEVSQDAATAYVDLHLPSVLQDLFAPFNLKHA